MSNEEYNLWGRGGLIVLKQNHNNVGLSYAYEDHIRSNPVYECRAML